MRVVGDVPSKLRGGRWSKVKVVGVDKPNKLITIKDKLVCKSVNRTLLRHCPDLWHDVIIPGLDGDGTEVPGPVDGTAVEKDAIEFRHQCRTPSPERPRYRMTKIPLVRTPGDVENYIPGSPEISQTGDHGPGDLGDCDYSGLLKNSMSLGVL